MPNNTFYVNFKYIFQFYKLRADYCWT